MRRWRSVIAFLIVILLILGMTTSIVFSFTTHGAEDVSGMQDELNALIEKREKLEKELESIKNKKDAALEEKEVIDQQIMDLNSEAEILDDLVDSLSDDLKKSQKALDEAESVLDENTELAKARIRAMYELGSTSYLNIILGAESLHDFIARVELVKQMTAYDQKVIDALKETKTTIEEETKAIEEKKNAQEDALNKLEDNVSSLKKKRAQSDSLIETFNAKSEANKQAILAAEKAEEQLQAEIRKALANSSNENFVGGQFLWPVQGYHRITSVFGYRTHPITGVYKLHTGVDIAGPGISGKPIMAANAGTVIKAGYNRGYGNYVVIDHGGGYSTLYGHASRLAVSAGQSVARGDTIAYVGTTGYSTGYHLHFEIIENGEYKNPLSYFNINFTYA